MDKEKLVNALDEMATTELEISLMLLGYAISGDIPEEVYRDMAEKMARLLTASMTITNEVSNIK